MRGEDTSNHTLFSYVRTDDRIPANHPLRLIRRIADTALSALSEQFDAAYATEGRPSIPPERLLRALLIQAFYSVRSERQLMEQLNYNLLFRWFVGLSVDDPVWDPSTFSKNRDRVLNEDFAASFLDAVLNADKVRSLVSSEHFSVDGTLIQAWASMKSFRRKDGEDQPPSGGRNGERDFHKEKPANETHASTTDPDARLYRKGRGKEAKLCFIGHLLMENRNGLIVDACLTKANDTAAFVAAAREMNVTPHVTQNINEHRGSNIDARTTRHPGYRISLAIRKRIEEANGWIKGVAGMDRAAFRGLPRMGGAFKFRTVAYNLIRMPGLLPVG